MPAELAGRTALITGAGRGIGAAIATGLARAGADVVLIARTAGQLEETSDGIRSAVPGANVRAMPVDLTDAQQRAVALHGLLSAKRIDILINNAATVEPLGATAQITSDAVRAAFEINVVVPFALTAAIVPQMVDAGWGRVVNVSSSVAGHQTSMIGANAYTSTKAALEAHSRNLAAELDGTGVTVNAYRPGGVDTDMQGWIRSQDPERIGSGLRDRFADRYEAGELITAHESATRLLEHLLGDDADVTGAIWNLGDTVAL